MGIISKIFAWGNYGSNAKHLDSIDWFAFFVLVLLLSFLWSKVVRQTYS
jgi:hypothetical protein